MKRMLKIALVSIGMMVPLVMQAQIVGGGGVKSFDNDPTIIKGIALVRSLFDANGDFLVGTGNDTMAVENGATARTSMGVAIGTDVQAYDADLTALGAGDGSVLTGNVSAVSFEAGTVATAIDISAATNLPAAGLQSAVQDSLGLADTSTQPGDNWTSTVNSVVAATVTDGAALGATSTQPGDNWTSTVNGVVAATVTDGAALGATATQPGDDWTNTVASMTAINVTNGATLGASALQPDGDAGALTNVNDQELSVADNVKTFLASANYAAMRTNLVESSTLYSGTYTNGPTGQTNVIVVLNGSVISVTLNP